MSAIAYRPEIDGLRAVAVGTVVLFHAQLGLFPGGFIGVDVFFVISGYLITSIIARELDATHPPTSPRLRPA
jgi:peptidoglycan/LPS O-acetylase OafA/YrhL